MIPLDESDLTDPGIEIFPISALPSNAGIPAARVPETRPKKTHGSKRHIQRGTEQYSVFGWNSIEFIFNSFRSWIL
jgi:hypothetical protein